MIRGDLLERRHVRAGGFEVVLLECEFRVGDELHDFRREVGGSRGGTVGRDGNGFAQTSSPIAAAPGR